MAQDILITPGSGEPQILFRGSGVSDTSINLNVISSHQSATGSGTALSFEGTQGQLFGVTDNLSSGTIFSVSDIVGLPLIEADASGDVKIGEYGRYVGIGSGIAPAYGLDVFSSGHFHKGLILAAYTPATTTNALYNVGGTLTFNGSTVGGTSDEATYASGQAIANETDIVAVSGIANYASGQVSVVDGVAEASKALVVDGSKNIATIGTVGCGAITSTGSSSFATSVKTPLIEYTDGDDAITIADGGIVTFAKATKPALKANADAVTITFDVNEANVHTVTLGDNRTFAISNETSGQKFMIRILQDGTGSRTVTWFSTIKWAGGSAPTLTTTASKADVVGFICTGTDSYDGFVIGQNI